MGPKRLFMEDLEASPEKHHKPEEHTMEQLCDWFKARAMEKQPLEHHLKQTEAKTGLEKMWLEEIKDIEQLMFETLDHFILQHEDKERWSQVPPQVITDQVVTFIRSKNADILEFLRSVRCPGDVVVTVKEVLTVRLDCVMKQILLLPVRLIYQYMYDILRKRIEDEEAGDETEDDEAAPSMVEDSIYAIAIDATLAYKEYKKNGTFTERMLWELQWASDAQHTMSLLGCWFKEELAQYPHQPLQSQVVHAIKEHLANNVVSACQRLMLSRLANNLPC